MFKLTSTYKNTIKIMFITIFSSQNQERFFFNFSGRLVVKGGEAPSWVEEPPSNVWFMVDSGAAISCKAKGLSLPRVSWYTDDGILISSIPGVREVSSTF